MRFKTRRASTCDYTVTGNQENPKTTVVEVYNNGENIDKDDENVDDTKHHNKTSNINPVVPKTLQFHDNGNNCDDDDVINFNEVNNEVISSL
jgi:hypothetical protein